MKRPAKKKKSRLGRVLLFLAIGGVVTAGIGWVMVSAWIQRYLRSDACREMLARQIGAAAKAQCEIDPLSWTGPRVYAARSSLTPLASVGGGWNRIEADGVQEL